MNDNPIIPGVLLGGALAAALYSWYQSRPSVPLPPGPKGRFMVGNALDIRNAKAPWLKFAEYNDQYGPIVTVRVLNNRWIIISDPHLVSELFEKRAANYSDKNVNQIIKLIGWDRSIVFLPYGPLLKRYRTMLHRALNNRVALDYIPLQQYEVRRFMRRLVENPSRFMEHIHLMAASIAVRIAYGHKVESAEDRFVQSAEEIMSIFSNLLKPANVWVLDMFPFLRYLPAWFPLAGFQRQAQYVRQLRAVHQTKPFECVLEQMANGTAEDSFTSKLLQPEDGQSVDDETKDQIKAVASSLYSAGSDTTVAGVQFFFLAMTLYPEVQAKAQAEIAAYMQQSGNDRSTRMISPEDRANLPYTSALVREVLRWHPIANLVGHRSSDEDDCNVTSGGNTYTIPARSLVLANIWQIMHDPEVYKEPERFMPERYLAENPPPGPESYAFGFGRRICPGIHIAQQSMWISISNTLANFTITKAKDESGAEITPKEQYSNGLVRLTTLTTLSNELKNNTFNTHDIQSNTELVHQVLNLLSDQEDSVSNQAADCLGQLIKVVRVSQGDQIICWLTEQLGGTNINLRDKACLGIEKLALELPQDNVIAPRAIRKIVPVILRHVNDLTASSETLIRALEILDVIVRRFPAHVCAMDPIIVPTSLFANGDAQVRKQAIHTAASVVSSQPITNIQTFIDTKVLSCLESSAAEVDEKLMAMDLISALAYHTIPNIEQVIRSILPSVKNGDGKLKNAGLRALERLVVFFSSEMAAYLPELVATSTECIKHHASNGEDIAMVDATGSNLNYSTDGMDDFDDDKIRCAEDDHIDTEAPYETRRLAIRLLSAVASTNLKSLPKFFEDAWHALIISLGDHEPTIRQASHSGLVVLLRLAYKFVSDRSNFEPADSFGRAKPLPETKELLAALDKLVPELLAPMLKVLSPNVIPHPATLTLLDAIINPLPEGCSLTFLTQKGFEPFEVQLYKVLVQPGTLRTFTYLIESRFPDEEIRSELVELMRSSDPSVAAEAIRAGLELIHRFCSEYCSIDDQDPAFPEGLQAEARRRMQDPHADATIRKLSAKVMGALLVAEFDCAEEDWELVRKMGATSVIRGAINMTDKFSHRGYDFAESWLQANTDWCIGTLRDGVDKDGGPTKLDVMECLDTLIWQHSRGGIEKALVGNIADTILPYLAPVNPALLNRSLELLDSIPYHNTRDKACLEIMEEKVLPRLYSLACEPFPSSSSAALLQLVGRIAAASQAIAIKMVSGFKSAFETKAGDASVVGTVSTCLARIATVQKSVAANIVEDFVKYIEPPAKHTSNLQVLCLLTMGKIARIFNMSQRPEIFDNALKLFESDSREVRDAAAFAVGSIATRSPEQHLPVIVKQIQTDGKMRSLYVRALKEFIPSCSQVSLASVAESLWQPLFDIHSTNEDSADITAVCLAKLARTNPSRFLPLLETRLQDPSPATRALAISTLRALLESGVTKTDGKNDEKELDERLVPLILVLLGMLDNQDLTTKKLILTALKQATSNKPRLVEDLVPMLLPKLYEETRSKLGTTKVAEAGLGESGADDGEEYRLIPYQILCDMFEAFPSKVDPPGFLASLLRGLSDKSKDVNEICLAMLFDLFTDAPTKVAQRLDDVTGPLRVFLKEAPADNDRGKAQAELPEGLQKLALDASAAFGWALGVSYDGAPRFAAFVKELENGPWGPKFKEERAKTQEDLQFERLYDLPQMRITWPKCSRLFRRRTHWLRRRIMDDDEGDVRVRVDPSASHYHAGETAVFTISFTNTRLAPTPQTPRPGLSRTGSEGQIAVYGRTRGHRRAISSVSEAKMARPPTSPGLRRAAPPTASKYIPSALASSASPQPSTPRQGLIGLRKKANGESHLHPVHSLSVSITSHDAFRELVRSGEDYDGVVAVNGSGTPTTPVGSRPPLPTRSRTSTGIPLSHPHARKQSATLDGAFPSASSLAHRLPATPSISTFSTSLAPITESTSSSDSLVPSPLGPGRDYRASLGLGPARRASTPSLSVQAPTPHGSPSSPHSLYPDADTPSPVTPNEYSAVILLAHAQLTGTLSLDPPSAALATSWRAAEAGTGRRVVGGGRVGIGVSHPRTRPRAASGVGAWLGLASGSSTDLSGVGVRAALGLGGLVSAGSSTASLASAPPDSPATRPLNGSVSRRRGHQRATSMASFIPGMASISALLSPFAEDAPNEGSGKDMVPNGGTVNGSAAADGMGPSATVEEGVYPVLETQPSVLAVDLALQPGETRSYTYSISLPAALPPSFRGKYFRLTYHLVVGTTRPDTHPDAGQIRRVIRVPIRMYTHVAVGQVPRPYDLMWPLARRREGAMLVGRVEEGKSGGLKERDSPLAHPSTNPISPDKGKITRGELEAYAKRLLATTPGAITNGMSKLQLQSPGGLAANTYEDDEGTDMSCRDAVEVVTRHSKKVSFDIAKDGQTVAVVTFVKAAYRLGETVLGAIEFNDTSLEGRVLKYSAILESTESLALHTPAPQTRKYAEHHASLALGTQRAAFSLDIPSDGAPSFALVLKPNEPNGKGLPNGHGALQNGLAARGIKNLGTVEGGLQWRVRMALVVCMSSGARHVVRDGPGNEWGDPWRAAGELAPLGPASDPNASAAGSESWGAFFGRWAGDEGAEGAPEGEEKWTKLKLETLECELPIAVFPGSTAYQPSGFDTWA